MVLLTSVGLLVSVKLGWAPVFNSAPVKAWIWGELPSAVPPVRVQVIEPEAMALESVYATSVLLTNAFVAGAVAEITGGVLSTVSVAVEATDRLPNKSIINSL